MEDQKRDLASHSDEELSVKGKAPRPSDLTVMILGKVGKFRSFKISSRVFFWSCIFFLLYILVSLLVINGYFSELRANRTHSELLEKLQDEIQETKMAFHQTRQHLTLLEDAIHDLRVDQKKPAMSAVPEAVAPDTDQTPLENEPVEKDEQEYAEMLVDVKDFIILKEETKLSVNFKLVNNTLMKESPVRGYIHIIAMNKASDPPQLWTYPKVALKNGIPVNHKRGQLFLIKRFKTIRGEFSLDLMTESPASIKVLVYDEPGKLIFQKEFEVKDAS